MIDVKQAVQIAKQGAVDVLGQAPYNLEEIERDTYKGRDVWSLTLSLPRLQRESSALASLGMPYLGMLQYKRFLIDVETGELVAVKMREVATQ
jgi:hypothetical protein